VLKEEEVLLLGEGSGVGVGNGSVASGGSGGPDQEELCE
jgi:hypothetical protein